MSSEQNLDGSLLCSLAIAASRGNFMRALISIHGESSFE